jgi:hypothetical protein
MCSRKHLDRDKKWCESISCDQSEHCPEKRPLGIEYNVLEFLLSESDKIQRAWFFQCLFAVRCSETSAWFAVWIEGWRLWYYVFHSRSSFFSRIFEGYRISQSSKTAREPVYVLAVEVEVSIKTQALGLYVASSVKPTLIRMMSFSTKSRVIPTHGQHWAESKKSTMTSMTWKRRSSNRSKKTGSTQHGCFFGAFQNHYTIYVLLQHYKVPSYSLYALGQAYKNILSRSDVSIPGRRRASWKEVNA